MARPTREELSTYEDGAGGSSVKLLQRILNALASMVSGKNDNGMDYLLPVDMGVTPVDGNTTGASPAVKAAGSWSFGEGLPAENDWIEANGVVFVFKGAPTGSNEIQLSFSFGGSPYAGTLANAVSVLNASTDPAVVAADYSTKGIDSITVLHKTPGEAGNSFTLSKSGNNLNVSGPTLTGGAEAVVDPVEPLLPVSLRFSAEGGSVEAGTLDNPLKVEVTNNPTQMIVVGKDAANQCMTGAPVVVAGVDGDGQVRPLAVVSDGLGGWVLAVKLIP